MERCSLCCDSSKNAYLNVATIQIGSEFISISDMTNVFKDLEQVWNSKQQKNICADCCSDLQSSYLFYKKCRNAKESLSEVVQEIHETSQLMPVKPRNNQPFKCCNQRFSTKSMLDKHKQITHAITCRFLCQSCPKLFLSKRSLQVHQISHTREKNSLQCGNCKKQFTHLGMFNKHKQRHNDVVCYYCNRGFSDTDVTKAHVADRHTDTENRFSCVSCKKTFGMRKILLRHFRTVHARTMPLFCGHCEEPFQSRNELKNHIPDCDKSATNDKDEYWNIERLSLDDELTTEWLNCEMLSNLNVDNDESMVEEFLDDAFEMLAGQCEELKCHHCSTVFTSTRDLIMHDITNHDSVKRDPPDRDKTSVKQDLCYRCPRCEEKFNKQNNLNIHLAHNHGEFVLLCNECGAAYNELNKLREHRKIHHMENISSLADTQATRDGKNLCTLCDKYFTTNGLKYHLKSHSNVIPAFTCPFCRKKFIANTNLNAHIRIRHSETKQYPCSHCERRFATMDHLKKHTASVHLHIRNFKCDFCDKSFRQKSHLNQHSWQHNGVKQYECSLCIKAYTSKSSLTKHTLKVHSLA